MSTYKKPSRDMVRLLDEVIGRYHQDLAEAKVKVYLLLAFAPTDENGERKGVAIRHHGYPALAKCWIVPTKQRVAGLGDAEILIDGDRWPDLDRDSQVALLDHELTHLRVLTDKDGAPLVDSAERPKLATRPHDRQFGWFDEVAKRHGRASVEVQQAKRLVDETGQLYLGEWGGTGSEVSTWYGSEALTRDLEEKAEKSEALARDLDKPAPYEDRPAVGMPRASKAARALRGKAKEAGDAIGHDPAKAGEARVNAVAADLALASIRVLTSRAKDAPIDVIRRAIELEAKRPKPRAGAMRVLEERLAELLEEADAGEQPEPETAEHEIADDPGPAAPTRPGMNPDNVRALFDEPGARA